jgi:2-oxoisovalerate dehydrogenase E1 component alpha subunit
VDGNDFLAVLGAGSWAVERARRGGGPTLIELVTYRRDAHSTSDDPTQYRAPDEAAHWPGGDPIERLRRHLVGIGEWSEHAHRDLGAALESEAADAFRQAESFGTTSGGLGQSDQSLFEDVYADMPAQLVEQMQELSAGSMAPTEESPLKLYEESRRAVG